MVEVLYTRDKSKYDEVNTDGHSEVSIIDESRHYEVYTIISCESGHLKILQSVRAWCRLYSK